MNYKIQVLNGFNMYFDQITSVFKTMYEAEESIALNQLSAITGLNRRKARIILNFLADLGFSQKRSLNKTNMGSIIYKHDEFLQNEGTLWLMHYLQSTNEYMLIWNRVMNALYGKEKVTRYEMDSLFEDLQGQVSDYTYKHHISQEVRVLLDAYCNQRFSKLNLLKKEDDYYIIHRNSDVHDFILLCVIILYRDIHYTGATALNIDEVCNANNSPGRIFILDEHIMRKRLERLKNKGMINIESRGDLDQIRFKEEIVFEKVLERYYNQFE
mgnify:CR=1 FL=1